MEPVDERRRKRTFHKMMNEQPLITSQLTSLRQYTSPRVLQPTKTVQSLLDDFDLLYEILSKQYRTELDRMYHINRFIHIDQHYDKYLNNFYNEGSCHHVEDVEIWIELDSQGLLYSDLKNLLYFQQGNIGFKQHPWRLVDNITMWKYNFYLRMHENWEAFRRTDFARNKLNKDVINIIKSFMF